MYKRSYYISCESVDCNDCLRPKSFMSLAQDAADFDVEAAGAGFDSLSGKGLAWVLARMHFTVREPARWKENVCLETWHRGTLGPFFVRDYVLRGEDGERKVTGVSSWVMLDTRERKMLKTEDALKVFGQSPSCLQAADEPCPKIVFPRDADRMCCPPRRVSFSDLDHNGHTNNAMYVSWALDCLPRELTTRSLCREVFINFSRETLPGDEIELFRCETAPGVHHVEGLRGGLVCFTAKLLF